MTEPFISVIICTHNRSHLLKKAILSLTCQSVPATDYEILVVDNRSTDNTKAIVKKLSPEFLNIKYIYEESLGLGYSRNTGCRHAEGDIIAYLDDDAIAASNWIERITVAFRESASKVAVIGGKTLPLWESPPPNWLNKRFTNYLSIIDWGPEQRKLNTNEFLVGANIAYRKEALVKVGGFPTFLGRQGKVLLSGEESFVNKMIENIGCGVLYDPTIIVHHLIPRERVTRKWLTLRSFWQGVTQSIIDNKLNSPTFSSTLQLKILKGIGAIKSLLLTLLFMYNQKKAFVHWCNAVKKLGYLLAPASQEKHNHNGH